MNKILPDETRIEGHWEVIAGAVTADSNCSRINGLTEEYLDEVAVADGGWSRLYKDPQDGRYWELTYPHSEWHGGGPPLLVQMTEIEAKRKYRVSPTPLE